MGDELRWEKLAEEKRGENGIGKGAEELKLKEKKKRETIIVFLGQG